ncbi:40S ribosomal protein S25-like [Onychomys torridus]|uniref:40S ribosomal protein S25-like n=1 Tax=Onychomys torridus TaxID=38674 RepID=UPI00167F79DD|nr:40S ribosomal protein S25-like [Onychomys torridus]
MSFVKHSIFLIGQERQRSSNKSGGRAKKKWSKGRDRDKRAIHDKPCKKFPTLSVLLQLLPERLKIQGSAARAALQELLNKDLAKGFQSTEPKSFTPEHKGGGALAAGKSAQ